MRHASNESGSWSRGASFRVYSDGQVALVAAPASVHAGNAQQFWAALAEAGASHNVIVVDLSATRLADHRALIPLLMALRVTDAAGSRLRVVAGDDVRQQLDASRLGRLIPVFESLPQALDLAALVHVGQHAPRHRRVSAAPARTGITVHWHAGPAKPSRE